MGEEKVGQGRENAKLYLEQNPDTAAKVEAVVREKIFQKAASQSAAASGNAASPAAASAAAADQPKAAAAINGAGVISADDLF
jgi:recombination protein RecA